MTDKTQPTDAVAQPATDRETHFYLAGWNGARKEVEANAHFRQALQAAPPAPAAVAVPDEQYQAQMAAISTAAIGYWKEGDEIHPDYDTVGLRDVAKLYVKYSLLFNALAAAPAQLDLRKHLRWALQLLRNDEGGCCGQRHSEAVHALERADAMAAWGQEPAAPAQEHATQLAGQGPTPEELMALSRECTKMPGGLGMHYQNYARAVLARWGAAPAQAQEDVPDPVRALIATHAEMLEDNAYAYFELAYTRQTGWMAWITDKPLYGAPVVNPDRKVLAQGQGDTPDEACADAARAAKGGAA